MMNTDVTGRFPNSYPYNRFVDECKHWELQHGRVMHTNIFPMPKFMRPEGDHNVIEHDKESV